MPAREFIGRFRRRKVAGETEDVATAGFQFGGSRGHRLFAAAVDDDPGALARGASALA